MEHVDFLAADAHKWLLGPCGAGLFFVKRDLQAKLNPPVYGWHNVRNPNFIAQETIEFRGGAAKFEAGHAQSGRPRSACWPRMELALEIGVDAHRRRTGPQTRVVRARLAGERFERAQSRTETGGAAASPRFFCRARI